MYRKLLVTSYSKADITSYQRTLGTSGTRRVNVCRAAHHRIVRPRASPRTHSLLWQASSRGAGSCSRWQTPNTVWFSSVWQGSRSAGGGTHGGLSDTHWSALSWSSSQKVGGREASSAASPSQFPGAGQSGSQAGPQIRLSYRTSLQVHQQWLLEHVNQTPASMTQTTF